VAAARVANRPLRYQAVYFLAYYATYQVTLANGKTLIPAEGLSANRALLFDENRSRF